MKSRSHLLMLSAVVLAHRGWAETTTAEKGEEVTYGLDVSFPAHYRVSTNYNKNGPSEDASYRAAAGTDEPLQILGNRQELYLNHLNGCRERFSSTGDSYLCDGYEYDRMLMNRRQPQSIINMTEIGFQKVRAPEHLIQLVEEFWKANQLIQTEEHWGIGNSYHNYWKSPTMMVSVDDSGLRGSGAKLKREIWAALSAVMEEWTQQELQPSSLYGVRVYRQGAVMMPQYVTY